MVLRIRNERGVTSSSSSSSNEADGKFEGQWFDGGQDNGFILAGGTHVGEFFFLAGVHVDILTPVVFTNDHSFVRRISRFDEESPAGFEIEQGIGHCRPGTIGHKGSGEPVGSSHPCILRSRQK